MIFPFAMNPLECLTGHGQVDPFWVWVLFGLCLTNGFEYLVIGWRWLVLFRFSTIQMSLIAIFVLCMLCGYWSFCIAIFDPNLGYSIKVWGLVILKAANWVFVFATFNKRFKVDSVVDMQIGQEIRRLAKIDEDINRKLDQIRETLRNNG